MTLVFDTETTGLPLDMDAPYTNTENWPRLVQLAAGIFDDDGTWLTRFCWTIKPEGFEIPANMIHGISQEQADRMGLPLRTVLNTFNRMTERAHLIVAHYYLFDMPVLNAEMCREGLEKEARAFARIPHYCTKLNGADLCQLPKLKNYHANTSQYKSPSLKELYHHLFSDYLPGAHDAGVDMSAAARCYFEMKNKGL